jgi:hypothetical protein
MAPVETVKRLLPPLFPLFIKKNRVYFKGNLRDLFMLPSGMSPKDYKDYCRLSQGMSTASAPFEAEDAVLQKSPSHAKGVSLRHQILTQLDEPSQELQDHLGKDFPLFLIASTFDQRCIVLNPLRHNMILMLETIRAIERSFQDYNVAEKDNLKPDGIKKYFELIHWIREFCHLTWNFFESDLLDGKVSDCKTDISDVNAQIAALERTLDKQRDFFRLIGASSSIVLFRQLLNSFKETLKTDAFAKKCLCVLSCPLDGVLDKKLRSPNTQIEPLPNFRVDSFKWMESSLEYVASCGDRCKDLFHYLLKTAALSEAEVDDEDEKKALGNFIEEVALLDFDVASVVSNIKEHLSKNTFRINSSTSLDFYRDGIMDLESLRKAVHELEPYELALNGFAFRFDVYQKAFQTLKALDYDKKFQDQFVTDIKAPFSFLSKLTQNLVLDHIKHLKKALHSTEQLFQHNFSKSAYITLLDLWAAKILKKPSVKKVDFLIKLYLYLDQNSKPPFESSLYQGLHQALKKLDDEPIDFVHQTPFSRSIDFNFNLRYFHTSQGNSFELDQEAVLFIQKNIKIILEKPISATISSKLAQELKTIVDIQDVEEFIDQGKNLLKKFPLLSLRNNIAAIVLDPLARSLTFEEDEVRSTPSPSLSGKKKKKSPSPSSSPFLTQPKTSRTQRPLSHKALFVGDFTPVEDEAEIFESRATPIAQNLIFDFHSLHLDPTILHAMVALNKDSKLFQSPILFYDETLNLFHNLLEYLLTSSDAHKHDLMSMIPASITLDPIEIELLHLLDKDRVHRLTAEPIMDSFYPHHNGLPVEQGLKEKFDVHQKVFFSLVAKCLRVLHQKEVDLSGFSHFIPCDKVTYHPRPCNPQLEDFFDLVGRLNERHIAAIALEKRQDFLIRCERSRQQAHKIRKSMRALNEALQILHPENTGMVDFSIAHQTLYHLSILTESVLLQLLLTKPTMSRYEPSRHIVFEVEDTRPLYNDHNTQRVLGAISIGMGSPISMVAQTQIETFRNFSNIVFRYLSQADDRCHPDYLNLLKILNLLAKDIDEVRSGFTTPDMVHLLGTDRIDQSQEKVHEIQRAGYTQITETVEKTLSALKELLIAHRI